MSRSLEDLMADDDVEVDVDARTITVRSAYHHYGGISPEGCTEPAAMLMVPRAVVEGLLECEPVFQRVDGWGETSGYECACCGAEDITWLNEYRIPHTDTCPWAMLRAVVEGVNLPESPES